MKKQKLKIDILEAEKSNLQSEKNILEAEKKTFEVRFEVGIQIFENSILILFEKINKVECVFLISSSL